MTLPSVQRCYVLKPGWWTHKTQFSHFFIFSHVKKLCERNWGLAYFSKSKVGWLVNRKNKLSVYIESFSLKLKVEWEKKIFVIYFIVKYYI
jgi:hypothetical protein